jgi:hypothetical protein
MGNEKKTWTALDVVIEFLLDPVDPNEIGREQCPIDEECIGDRECDEEVKKWAQNEADRRNREGE